MWLIYYIGPRIINTVVCDVMFNYMTELSATILELIYDNKDAVTQNSKQVYGENQQNN